MEENWLCKEKKNSKFDPRELGRQSLVSELRLTIT